MAPESKGKRVAIYLRVSTNEQTTANQRRELKAVANRHRWPRAPRAATNALGLMP
jgi:DNA invertase Pin-like site-specific DNA recombinase